MSIWNTIAGLGQGYQQGQDWSQNLRAKALTIQKAQAELDQQKQGLQAQALAFQGLMSNPNFAGVGPPQGPTTAMPPGAPSTSSLAPPGAAGPAVPVTSAGPVAPPGAAPGAALPGGGQSTLGGQPGAGGPPGAPPGDGGDPYSPQGEVQLLRQMALALKRANPNASDQQLAGALQSQIELLKGFSGAQRPYLQSMTQRDIAAEKGKVSLQEAQMRYQTAHDQIAGQLERTTYIQTNLNQRFQAGQMSRAAYQAAMERSRLLTGQLNAAQRELGSLNTALVPSDDPRYVAAQKKLDDAQGRIDTLENSLPKDDATPGSGAAAPTASPPGSARPTSPAPKKPTAAKPITARPVATPGGITPGYGTPNEIPLPEEMKRLKDGETAPDDLGRTWRRKGNIAVLVPSGG